MKTVLAVIGGIAVSLLVAATAGAATRYVDASAAAGGTGTSESPYQTIQQGINASQITGDTVIVAAGIYQEHIDFSGKQVTVQSSDPANSAVVEATIIDGTHTGTVVTISGVGAGAVLNGFTVRNGENSGTASSHGGGLDIQNASPQILNCVIRDNHTATDGGGMAIVGNSAPLIQGNTIVANTADGWGGGVYVFGDTSNPLNIITATPTLVGNRISANTAVWDGGGVACFEACAVVIRKAIVDNNDSGQVGGGIFVGFGATANVENVTLADNSALGSPEEGVTRVGRGGGLACWFSGATTCNSSILWGNTAKNSEGNQLSLEGNAVAGSQYSSLQGGSAAVYVQQDANFTATFTWGAGSVAADPLFAPTAGDYHLRSNVGRWDPALAAWVIDAVQSPMIDAGSPALDFSQEPAPAGAGINAGGYGNTPEASMGGTAFTIALVPDTSWAYENTPISTAGRNKIALAINVTGDVNGNTAYTAGFTRTAGTGVLEPVAADATGLQWNLKGGLRGSIPSPIGPATVEVVCRGNIGGAGVATTDLAVRILGDINGDGIVNSEDKLALNRNLNGLDPGEGITVKALDLNGDDVRDATDKLIINQILNGVAVP